MEEKVSRRFSFIINTVYFVLIGFIILMIIRYFFPYMLPFILGFLIAFALKPFAHWTAEKTGVSKRLCSAVIILIFYVIIGIALWFLGAKLIASLMDFINNLEGYIDEYIIPIVDNINDSISTSAAAISPSSSIEVNQTLSSIVDSIESGLGEMTGAALSWLAGIGSGIPNFLLSFAFTIMASIFIIMDYHQVTGFIVKQFPERYKPMVFEIRKYFSVTMLQYIKAYVILMGITFVELAIGFVIIDVKNPILVAAVIALCDALPVLGTGGVVIPWILIELIKGNYSFAIGLTILYIIVTIIRNFIEPKVLSKQLGLNPLVMLITIYIGLKTMGIVGMIGFPMLLHILVSLHNSGTLQLWKE